MFGPPYDPGEHDRAEADFETRLLERSAAPEESPQPGSRGILWLLGNWGLLLAVAALIAFFFQSTVAYIAIALALGLIAAAQVALAVRRRRNTEDN